MKSADLNIVMTCARQLLCSAAAAQTPAAMILKAWQAMEACEIHATELADAEQKAGAPDEQKPTP